MVGKMLQRYNTVRRRKEKDILSKRQRGCERSELPSYVYFEDIFVKPLQFLFSISIFVFLFDGCSILVYMNGRGGEEVCWGGGNSACEGCVGRVWGLRCVWGACVGRAGCVRGACAKCSDLPSNVSNMV